MLCQQHGTVHLFNHNANARIAFASFTRPDDALKAQHALTGYVLANVQLSAEFIPDVDACRLATGGFLDYPLSSNWSDVPQPHSTGAPVWYGPATSNVWNVAAAVAASNSSAAGSL